MNPIAIFLGIGTLLCVALFAIDWRVPSDNDTAIRPDKNAYRYVPVACWFNVDYTRDIKCGELLTPLSSGGFRLPVVIIKNSSTNHRNDPVLYLSGGPGVSSSLNKKGIESWLLWLDYADFKRDLILMDARGTGGAKPQLFCTALQEFNLSLINKNIPLAEERIQGREVIRECLSDLSKVTGSFNPLFFGTAVSAQDSLALIQNLDYQEWNILGVSYGTRLGLEIERQYQAAQFPLVLNSNDEQPQFPRLKSMVLDSIYPAGLGGVDTLPQVVGEAFKNFFHSCASSKKCIASLGEQDYLNKPQSLEQFYFSQLHKLNKLPVSLTLRVGDELPQSLLVNDSRFLAATFSNIYNISSWPLVIEALKDVSNNRDDQLKIFMQMFLSNSVNPDYNELAFLLVDCVDNGKGNQKVFNESLRLFPNLAHYFVNEWDQQACHDMALPPPLVQEVSPRTPTLILAGTEDPITPVHWARDLQQRWPAVHLLERQGVGHVVTAEAPCILTKLVDFYDAPDEEKINSWNEVCDVALKAQ